MKPPTTSGLFQSLWTTTLAGFSIIIVVFCFVVPAAGLKCIQCGQYNDGVGSITPCLNYTVQTHLKECPTGIDACIKYINGGTTVRECSPGKCIEKRSDARSTSMYCCSEDGCNGNAQLAASISTLFILSCSHFIYH